MSNTTQERRRRFSHFHFQGRQNRAKSFSVCLYTWGARGGQWMGDEAFLGDFEIFDVKFQNLEFLRQNLEIL